MDFGRVLETVAGFFERTGFRDAVIGAFGLHAYGLSRGTFDLERLFGACRTMPGLPTTVEDIDVLNRLRHGRRLTFDQYAECLAALAPPARGRDPRQAARRST